MNAFLLWKLGITVVFGGDRSLTKILARRRINQVFDASYAKQKLGWETKRGPFEVLKQNDESDFEVLP